MTPFNSAILGIIQGITEMLPVSSSTHLLFFSKLRNLPDQRMSFDLFLNIGTVLAIVVFFWPQIWELIKGGFDFIRGSKSANRELFATILLANIPVIIVGGIFERFLGNSLHSPLLIASSLVIFGAILWWCDCLSSNYSRTEASQRSQNFWDSSTCSHQQPFKVPTSSSTAVSIRAISRHDAIVTGFAQVFGLIPGVSRLGACFSMLRYLKYQRLEAFKFSMILSLIPVCGACFLKTLKVCTGSLVIKDWSMILLGCSFSFVFGLISLLAITTFLKRHGMLIFFIYRVICAIAILTF